MPFKSKAQAKFAFGTKQPWAKEWGDESKGKKLPARAPKMSQKQGGYKVRKVAK